MQLRRIRPGVTLIALALWLAACSSGPTPVVQTIAPAATVSPSSVTVTPAPSVDQMTDPRIDGRYVVLKKVTGVRNFTGIKIGDVLHRMYNVTPSCPIGPCGGSIKINLAETDETVTRKLSYDETTQTYTLVPIVNPVICTGVDGKRYKLKHTTDTFVITPMKTEPTSVDTIVTKWTGEEILKAVPDGPALNRGHCKVTVVNYTYTGALK